MVRTEIAFFAVPSVTSRVDCIKLWNLSAPVAGTASEPCPTVVVDLRLTEIDLWNAVEAKTRKAIRQAVRDGIVVEQLVALTEQTWQSLLCSYGKLRQRRRNAGALGVGQISELATSGRLAMSRSRDGSGNVLSWHVYVCGYGRSRLLCTISEIDPKRDSCWNNLVGRAHRLHHWHDILAFKAAGFVVYDFGGVYRGTTDREQINIARFKSSFGGMPVETFDAVLALTRKGRIASWLASLTSAQVRAGGAG